MSDESGESDGGADEFTWGVSESDEAGTSPDGSESADAAGDASNANDAGWSGDRDRDRVHGDVEAHEHERAADQGHETDAEYEPSLAGVVGANREDEPVRRDLVPESPSLENAIFLLVGVLLGIYVIYEAATAFGV